MSVTLPPLASEQTLKHVLEISQYLVKMLIHSGVGYQTFSNSIKPIFYNEAVSELETQGVKTTDSALSLVSGMSRREVNQLKSSDSTQVAPSTMSVPSRVMTLWVEQQLPRKLAFSGEKKSFEALVKQISTEKHPRSIANELQRLGLVDIQHDYICLKTESYVPAHDIQELEALLAKNVSAHLAAGVHNIYSKPNRFLEQSLFVDELSPESVKQLEQYSLELWSHASEQLLHHAMRLCKQDQDKVHATHKFCVGIYQHHDDIE